MAGISMHAALREMAVRIPQARSELEALAGELERAVGDRDKVVGPDEHFKIVKDLAEVEQKLTALATTDPSVAPDLKLIADLSAGLDHLVRGNEKRFRAYTIGVDNERLHIDTPRSAPKFKLRDPHHVVLGIPRGQFESLVSDRYVLSTRQGWGKHFDVGADDYVLGDMRFVDQQTGKTVKADQIYDYAKRAAFDRCTFNVADIDECDRSELNLREVLTGHGQLPVESFANLACPATWAPVPQGRVEGVRLVWVLAQALVGEGRLPQSQLSQWQADGQRGVDLAAHEVARLLHGLSLSSGAAEDRNHLGSDDIERLLKGAVLAFSRHPSLEQAVPDATEAQNGRILFKAPVTSVALLSVSTPGPVSTAGSFVGVSDMRFECLYPKEWVIDESFAPAFATLTQLLGKSDELRQICKQIIPTDRAARFMTVDFDDPVIALVAPPVSSTSVVVATASDRARSVRNKDVLAAYMRIQQAMTQVQQDIDTAQRMLPTLDPGSDRYALMQEIVRASTENLATYAQQADAVRAFATRAGIDMNDAKTADNFLLLFARTAFTNIGSTPDATIAAADAFFHELVVHVRQNACCGYEYDGGVYDPRVKQHFEALKFEPNSTASEDRQLFDTLKTGAFVLPSAYPSDTEIAKNYQEIVRVVHE